MSAHLVVHLAYVGALAALCALSAHRGFPARTQVLTLVGGVVTVLATTALMAMVPFVALGEEATIDKIFAFITKMCPCAVTLLGLWCASRPLLVFGFLLSWLSVLHFSIIVAAINYKFAMFQYIMRKLVSHLPVFAFVLLGFAIAFHFLYAACDTSGRFRSLWDATQTTSLFFLQGDLSAMPLLQGGSQSGQHDTHRTATLSFDLKVAGGIMQLLFVVVAVLALFNMWVGLAVRGGKEFKRQGHLHYSLNQVRTLQVLEFVSRWLNCARPQPLHGDASSEPFVVREGESPPALLAALQRAANRHRQRSARKWWARSRTTSSAAAEEEGNYEDFVEEDFI